MQWPKSIIHALVWSGPVLKNPNHQYLDPPEPYNVIESETTLCHFFVYFPSSFHAVSPLPMSHPNLIQLN